MQAKQLLHLAQDLHPQLGDHLERILRGVQHELGDRFVQRGAGVAFVVVPEASHEQRSDDWLE